MPTQILHKIIHESPVISISDLIIETTTEESEPYHSFVHTEKKDGPFTVISSDSPSLSYKTIVTGKIVSAEYAKKKTVCRLVGNSIREYFDRLEIGDGFRALVVGIGNPSVTSDSLGSRTADKIAVDGERVFSLRPLTQAKTGIETASLVSYAAKDSSADVIITVDSLTARHYERLGTVIQITDSGITPGSGVSSASGEISSATMPCPVISVGVPTVIRSDILVPSDGSLLVTPASVDSLVEAFSSVIAGGINLSLYGNI